MDWLHTPIRELFSTELVVRAIMLDCIVTIIGARYGAANKITWMSFFAGLIGLCIVDWRAALMLYLTPMGITLIILALVYLDVIAERFEKTKRGQFVKHATKSDLVDLVALLLYKFDKRDGE